MSNNLTDTFSELRNPRPGRPRVHATDSAKKAAYRQRKFERELAALRRAASRRLPKSAPRVERDLVAEARAAYLAGDHKLALSLFEQHESQQEMAEYDREVVREKRRAAKPAKHNRSCRKNACLCGLTMSRGLFLTDAPKGCGKLVSGGYGSSKVSLVSDAHQSETETEEELGGHHVAPSGWSLVRDNKTDAKKRDSETDSTFMEKHFQDKSWLKCYVAGCSRLPGAVLLEPEDYDGSPYYCCELHLPTRID
jgi:hypothetical protein